MPTLLGPADTRDISLLYTVLIGLKGGLHVNELELCQLSKSLFSLIIKSFFREHFQETGDLEIVVYFGIFYM